MLAKVSNALLRFAIAVLVSVLKRDIDGLNAIRELCEHDIPRPVINHQIPSLEVVVHIFAAQSDNVGNKPTHL